MSKPIQLLLTCEHGGNRVPKRYSALFRDQEKRLNSHHGYDFGALPLARRLAKALQCPLIANTTTRMLVDLNRGATNRGVFSDVTRGLDSAERAKLLTEYHTPHRAEIEQWVARATRAGGRVLHIGVHSFTPSINGVERNADVGLLYDPASTGERTFCKHWQTSLANLAPNLIVRCNYPYRGTSDGVPTWLRRQYPSNRYWGVELEVNYRCFQANGAATEIFKPLLRSFEQVFAAI